MKGYFILFLVLRISIISSGLSQEIPQDYKLLVRIERPHFLKWGIPNKIIYDSTANYFAISYDYNPTYLDLYKGEDFDFLERIVIKGYVYEDNSYFHIQDNSLYIDRGRNKNKYVKLNLSTFEKTKIDCKDAPRSCPYSRIFALKTLYILDYTIKYHEWYIIRYNNEVTEIYIKQ